MAHFAKIDENNVVTHVVVVPDSQESRGQEFLANDLKLGGTWIQTSYNNNVRGRFAGIGMLYNRELDMFISQSPYDSWILNTETGSWEAPVEIPSGIAWVWDEETTSWLLDINFTDTETITVLSGIGPSLAQAIIAERENGGYTSAKDLANRVSGIGSATIESWTNVTFGDI